MQKFNETCMGRFFLNGLSKLFKWFRSVAYVGYRGLERILFGVY